MVFLLKLWPGNAAVTSPYRAWHGGAAIGTGLKFHSDMVFKLPQNRSLCCQEMQTALEGLGMDPRDRKAHTHYKSYLCYLIWDGWKTEMLCVLMKPPHSRVLRPSCSWLRKWAVFQSQVSVVVHGKEEAMGRSQEALMSFATGVKSSELDSWFPWDGFMSSPWPSRDRRLHFHFRSCNLCDWMFLKLWRNIYYFKVGKWRKSRGDTV